MSVTQFEAVHTVSEATLTCLSDERRQEILRVLQQHDTPIDRRTLAEHVAVAEQEYSQHAIKSVETTLYHTHLPKLEAASLITYDDQQARITLDSLGEQAQALLADL